MAEMKMGHHILMLLNTKRCDVQVGPDKLEVIGSFCFLDDICFLLAEAMNLPSLLVCENGLEKVKGATASSHIPSPLLQDPWP